MTNKELVIYEKLFLVENGLLDSIDDDLYTYAEWLKRGFRVKKGEKAVASFPIWKHVNKKNIETGEEYSKIVMKTAYFFTRKQVEREVK